ncbi:MAG: hypothetical protein M9894_28800 [Planctomycetes bacterium]|nr:hypothetical protein [Planctomycetota bacterium]
MAGLAWLAPHGCASSSQEREDPHYQVGPDGRSISLNLAHRDIQPIFQQPRRYPFTVAVAPLYVDWADGGRVDGTSTVHRETLNTPIPGDDPRQQARAAAWPRGSDSPDEEMLILQATRAGFDERAAETTRPGAGRAGPAAGEGAPRPERVGPPPPPPSEPAPPAEPAPSEPEPVAPAEPAPATDPGAAPGDDIEPVDPSVPPDALEPEPGPPPEERRLRRIGRLRALLEPGAACPPDEPTSSAADTASASTLTYAPPGDWVRAAPARARPRLIDSHASPDGRARLVTEWAPRAELAAPDQPLDTADAGPWRARLEGWVPDVKGIERAEWIELGGAPALEAHPVLDMADGTASLLWVVFTADRVFTLELAAADAASLEELAAGVRGTVKVQGRPPAPAPAPAPSPAAAAKPRPQAADAEIDRLDGKNFGIRETGFQDRFSALLEQFGVFERVEKLQFVTDSQRRDPTQLFTQADSRGADLMIVATLRRNKVSYTGVNAKFIGDMALWLFFWWPSEIWPGVRSEEYRSDVELVLEIHDVRSRAPLWSTTYRADETMALSAPERGWIPWGPVLVNIFGLRTDGLYSEAGGYVRPRTWLEIEYQILRDLWSPEGFKGVIDTRIRPTFEDRVNVGVEPRRQALVVGVARYGPAAAPVLEAAARERGESLEALRREYGDETLSLGMRPYAETDAQLLREFLVNEAGFGSGDVRLLTGPRATRVQLKAALRQFAKARRPDPVILYLNGQVVVADDPRAPGDELRKYFLPYDADLAALEALRERGDAQGVLEHLDRTAIPFEWITATFNQDDIQDHRYLMSRDVLLVFDAAFPGPLGLRYAPRHAAQVASGWTPTLDGARSGTTTPPEQPTPPEDTRSPPEDTRSPPEDTRSPPAPPAVEQPPVEQPPVEQPPVEQPPVEQPPVEQPQVEQPPVEQPQVEQPQVEQPQVEQPVEQPPAEQPPVEQPERPRPRRVGARPGEATTLPAQAEAERRGGAGPLEARLTEDFLQVLARPGRKVVVTARFNERPLDVIPQRAGAFVYHFLRGARDRSRVPGNLVDGPGGRQLVVPLRALLDYARARIEDESRTLNRPQSLLALGDNDSLAVIQRGQ